MPEFMPELGHAPVLVLGHTSIQLKMEFPNWGMPEFVPEMPISKGYLYKLKIIAARWAP